MSYLHHISQQHSSIRSYNSHNMHMEIIRSIKDTYQKYIYRAFFYCISVFTCSFLGIYKLEIIRPSVFGLHGQHIQKSFPQCNLWNIVSGFLSRNLSVKNDVKIGIKQKTMTSNWKFRKSPVLSNRPVPSVHGPRHKSNFNCCPPRGYFF